MASSDQSRIVEFRIPVPLKSEEEFRLGQRWSVCKANLLETGGGEGVESIMHEPYNNFSLNDKPFPNGQYTHKLYHLASKVPRWVRILAPKGDIEMHEKAWNAYPVSHTEISNGYMKSSMLITCDTIYVENDTGDSENVHGLEKDELDRRQVQRIDIINDRMEPSDYREEWDPSKVTSTKTGRGPIPIDGDGSWMKSQPMLCCYKLLRVKFMWYGLQMKVEKTIIRAARRHFLNFHRQAVCWLDEYHEKTYDELTKYEAETKRQLDLIRQEQGEVRGMTVN